jgi:hypothetical protein
VIPSGKGIFAVSGLVPDTALTLILLKDSFKPTLGEDLTPGNRQTSSSGNDRLLNSRQHLRWRWLSVLLRMYQQLESNQSTFKTTAAPNDLALCNLVALRLSNRVAAASSGVLNPKLTQVDSSRMAEPAIEFRLEPRDTHILCGS